MSLVRWQPFRDLTNLQREMNQLFESLGDRNEDFFPSAFVPAAEIQTDEGNVYVSLEVPGLKPEEIEVNVSENSVSITGERKEEKTSEEKGIKRSEFRYGKFHRVMSLPGKVKQDAVQAKYENGVLKLTMPKAEDEKHKTVKVQVAS